MMLCVALTKRCTLRCLTCLNGSGPSGDYGLPTETLEEVLAWLAEQDQPQVDFSGGEPLGRRDIADLIRLAQQCGVQVNVCTNGCTVNDAVLELLADIRRITVTFYGVETYHDSITQVPGSYQKAIRTIVSLRGSRARVRANIVTLAGALDGLPALVDALQVAGATEIKFSMASPTGRAASLISQLTTRSEIEWLAKTIAVMGHVQVPMIMQRFAGGDFYCEIPKKNSLFLTQDGYLYPCPLFQHLHCEIGRLNENQSAYETLKEIHWDEALARHTRAGENQCPALDLGVFKNVPGGIVHPGCPPLVERR